MRPGERVVLGLALAVLLAMTGCAQRHFSLGNKALGFADITSFQTESAATIRAVGFLNLGHGTNLTLVVMGMIYSALTYRKLKPWEMAAIPLCVIAAIVPQVRILLPGTALAGITP